MAPLNEYDNGDHNNEDRLSERAERLFRRYSGAGYRDFRIPLLTQIEIYLGDDEHRSLVHSDLAGRAVLSHASVQEFIIACDSHNDGTPVEKEDRVAHRVFGHFLSYRMKQEGSKGREVQRRRTRPPHKKYRRHAPVTLDPESLSDQMGQ